MDQRIHRKIEGAKMKFLILGLLIVSSPLMAQHNHHESGSHESIKRKAIDSKDKVQIIEILKKNDLLFNAFLKKESGTIEKSAKDLLALVSQSQSTLLKETKAQASNLAKIKSSNSNESNLQAYETFLNPLIKVVQANDIGGKYNIYSCPMVKKSWIQDTDVNKDVKNVYAMDMLECGTKDTQF